MRSRRVSSRRVAADFLKSVFADGPLSDAELAELLKCPLGEARNELRHIVEQTGAPGKYLPLEGWGKDGPVLGVLRQYETPADRQYVRKLKRRPAWRQVSMLPPPPEEFGIVEAARTLKLSAVAAERRLLSWAATGYLWPILGPRLLWRRRF